jgi:hypothetical protein
MIRIAAWLDGHMADSLRQAQSPSWLLYTTPDLDEFLRVGSTREIEVAVVGVGYHGESLSNVQSEVDRLSTALRSIRHPVVLLSEDSWPPLQVAIGIARRMPATLAVLREGGSIDGIVEAVDQAAAAHLAAKILVRLEDRLPKLRGSSVVLVAERLLFHPEAFDVETAAIGYGPIGSAALKARFRSVGLASPRAVHRAGRLAMAYQLRRAHGLLLKQIVARAGYGSPDSFEREVHRFSGCSPSEFLDRVPEVDLIERLVTECCIAASQGLRGIAAQ